MQNIFQGYMEGTTSAAGGQVGTGSGFDNRNTGNLYTIDVKSSRVVGDPLSLPVNPFSLAQDGNGALWVGSQPENKLSRVLTGRGG